MTKTNGKGCACSSPSRRSSVAAPRTPFMIGVAGGTASGKSTVCTTLVEKLGQSEVGRRLVEMKPLSVLFGC